MSRCTRKNVERIRRQIRQRMKRPLICLPTIMPRWRMMALVRKQLAIVHQFARKERTARYLARCALLGYRPE